MEYLQIKIVKGALSTTVNLNNYIDFLHILIMHMTAFENIADHLNNCANLDKVNIE